MPRGRPRRQSRCCPRLARFCFGDEKEANSRFWNARTDGSSRAGEECLEDKMTEFLAGFALPAEVGAPGHGLRAIAVAVFAVDIARLCRPCWLAEESVRTSYRYALSAYPSKQRASSQRLDLGSPCIVRCTALPFSHLSRILLVMQPTIFGTYLAHSGVLSES